MNDLGDDLHLNNIQTFWTVLDQAHGATPEATAAAQQLVQRYTPAVYQYLLGALRDPDAAEELRQEFALRLMRGDLHRADPKNGRFRDFVKRVLFHLIADHYRRLKRERNALPTNNFEDALAIDDAENDRQFLESWRTELLNRAWASLEQLQGDTGQLFYAVLRQRADRPEQRSAEMAEELSARLGKPLNAVWVRQMLHRAREKFVNLILDETRQTLQEPTLDELEQELIDLRLHEYCREALDKMRT